MEAQSSDTALTSRSGKKKGPQAEPKPRPDHFLSARIWPWGSAHESIKLVQEALSSHDQALQAACVDPFGAHLTLLVARLDTPERLETARSALQSLQQRMQHENLLQPLKLHMRGLSHFHHKVLYLDVAPSEDLKRLSHITELARDVFQEHGLLDDSPQDAGSNAFTPHVTIAKLSKLMQGKWRKGKGKKKEKLPKKLPPEAYEALLEVEGGSSTIASIDLCQMQHSWAQCRVVSTGCLSQFNGMKDDAALLQAAAVESGACQQPAFGLLRRSWLCLELSNRVYDAKLGRPYTAETIDFPASLQNDCIWGLPSKATATLLHSFIASTEHSFFDATTWGLWHVEHVGYVVAIRGSNAPLEWLSNTESTGRTLTGGLLESWGLELHDGIYSRASGAAESIMQALRRNASIVKGESNRLLLTGHSLGGGIALSLLNNDTSAQMLQHYLPPDCRVHNFVNGLDLLPRALGQSLRLTQQAVSQHPMTQYLTQHTTGLLAKGIPGLYPDGVSPSVHRFAPFGHFHFLADGRYLQSADALEQPNLLHDLQTEHTISLVTTGLDAASKSIAAPLKDPAAMHMDEFGSDQF
ncbi:hypothetical protein WJX73_002339 [Symbiochloris irregularis]|uniref:Protein kinase A anchor protein nuclear localisation signal domain-containing protein n=1 Tax=Symbiochloris irregularis TaxID=706552 RepID=A0AAW1PLN4_9CHLO